MSITALVLAAGLGTRMRASKPLIDVGGRPALARVLATLASADLNDVIVVLGRNADQIAQLVDLTRVCVIRNPEPGRGLASSLARGLAAVPSHAAGVLVFHADMPFVQPDTVRAVSRLAHDGARLAAPRFGNQRGFPVYFSRACLPDLVGTLSGDSGGRLFIERNRRDLELADVDDSGCVQDLDRPEDLARSGKEVPWTTCA